MSCENILTRYNYVISRVCLDLNLSTRNKHAKSRDCNKLFSNMPHVRLYLNGEIAENVL